MFIVVLMSNSSFSQFGNLKVEVPKSSEKVPLLISDIDPAFKSIPVAFDSVTYERIDDPAFDEFFKSAAKMNGLNMFAVNLCSDATAHLKSYARSKYADPVLKKQIDDLTNNTPPQDWSVEQAFLVERTAMGKKKVSAEEIEYFVKTGISLTLVGGSLAKGVQSAGELLQQGSNLLTHVSSLGAKAIAASSAIKACVENLDKFTSSVPLLIKQFYALGTGIGQTFASGSDESASTTTATSGSAVTSESKSSTTTMEQKSNPKVASTTPDKPKELARPASADASKRISPTPVLGETSKRESSAPAFPADGSRRVSKVASSPKEPSKRGPTAAFLPGEASKGAITIPSYVAALTDFNSKKYDEAIRTFQQVLDTKISQNLTGHCQYWIGESYFGKRDFQQALMHFEAALQATMPQKTADAHFMAARCCEILKDNEKAKEHFAIVAKEFPNTELAQLSLKHLKNL